MLKKNIPIIISVLVISLFGCIYNINAPDNKVTETQSIIRTAEENQLNFDINAENFNSYNSRNIGWGLKKEKGKARKACE